jgi:4-carboxymuconolactone decarboxylase
MPAEGEAALAAKRITPMDKKLWDTGLAKRREVLGNDYVDRNMNNVDDFNRPFQDMLNEYCWGGVWGDERLSKREHSLINLGMIAGLNRMHEWELHLRGAIRNGITKDEIQAVLHQIAVYAGAPAGVECFRIARKVYAELEGKG